jgi:peptidoglycan/LPS O-acetylase OafA/YrhL
MLLTVLSVEIDDGLVRLPDWWRRAATAALVALASGVAICRAEGWIGQYQYDTLEALACALLLALVVLPDARRASSLKRTLETRAATFLGLVSYSLFLWHEPVVWWMRIHGLTFSGVAGFGINIVVIGSITVALAALTYRFVELPALKRKKRASPQVDSHVALAVDEHPWPLRGDERDVVPGGELANIVEDPAGRDGDHDEPSDVLTTRTSNESPATISSRPARSG